MHAGTQACIGSVLALLRLSFKKLQVQHTVAAQRCGPVDNGCRACTATFNTAGHARAVPACSGDGLLIQPHIWPFTCGRGSAVLLCTTGGVVRTAVGLCRGSRQVPRRVSLPHATHSTAQHSTAQHSTAQRRWLTAERHCLCRPLTLHSPTHATHSRHSRAH